MPIRLEVIGLDELREKYHEAPEVLDRAIQHTMWESLALLWQHVPPYPAKKNPDQKYIRTGTLGRSIGTDMNGKQLSTPPSVYTVKREGQYNVGTFGTNLEYAPFVIGDNQAQHHRGWWWVMKTIADRAVSKIERRWVIMVEELGAWLDGRASKPRV